MENKTKVKIAVVIGIMILTVIFIFMVIFVKGNGPKKNKNIPTIINGYAEANKNTIVDNGENNTDKPITTGKPQTLDNVVSIAVKGKKLVRINSDFTDTEITELENGYSEFCYGENKVYTVFNNENGKCSIFEIDLLKSNYPQKEILTSNDYGAIKNISYYSGKLYFVSQIGQLIEYSISEEYSKALTNQNEVSSFAIDKQKNVLYVAYKPNGANAGIYILDFTANSFNQIISSADELPKSVMLNGKSLVIHIGADLYVYNIETSSVVNIGSGNYLTSLKNHVAFYDNILLYTDGASINLKDASGNTYKDNWYILNDRTIASISMIDSKTLQLARYGVGSNIPTRSVIIDLVSGTTKEIPDSVYTEIVRIK